MVFRRFMSTRAAHKLVQQRVQGQLSRATKAQPGALPKTRVLFVAKPATAAALQAALPFPVSAAALGDFQAKPQEKMYLYPSADGDQRVLLVGLGAEDKITENLLRDATHGALTAVRAKRAKDVLLQVPSLPGAKIAPERVVELFSQVSRGSSKIAAAFEC